MSTALVLAVKEFAQEMKKHRIEVNTEQHTLLTKDIAMPLQFGLSTDKYRKIIRDVIAIEQSKAKAKQEAKQSKLF